MVLEKHGLDVLQNIGLFGYWLECKAAIGEWLAADWNVQLQN
jgi:hypothetical protein